MAECMSEAEITNRYKLTQARRIVVKVGSRVLVQQSGRPEMRRIRTLVKDLAWLRHQGCDVVLVSSGAVGAGMEALGIKRKPTNLPDLQMAAAVGQNRLMARYDKLFSEEGCLIGQVLLTHDVLNNRVRHLNARNTMLNMFRHGIIPIVNENDVIAADEIKLGDNDVLASLVALLTQADVLVLLSTTDGLRAPTSASRTRRVSFLEGVNEASLSLAVGKGSDLSSGGMATKLQAAQTAAKGGVLTVLADGRKPGILRRIRAGEDVGTLIALPGERNADLSGRKRWIAFFHRACGSIVVDEGAGRALEEKGKSLLPIGIREVQGEFPVGAVVNVKDAAGRLIARGLTEYASSDIVKIMGRRTSEISAILGRKDYDEVIHRDNMVLMKLEKGEIA
ncbi:MAG: glutamate 5-kinase [Spartobacteria bacterium]|nr:glutamate 5-kinase [Spartobacteria bacterium]